MTLHFLIPGNINTLTGGYIYNKIIATGLDKLGYSVAIHQLTADFPFPSNKSLSESKEILGSIPADEIVFIDSLAFGPLYPILSEDKGLHIIIPIIHLPLSFNPNFSEEVCSKLKEQEALAFKYARRVVAVSEFTSRIIMNNGVNPEIIKVIIPGVYPVLRKMDYPELPAKLLCVGSYLPGKGQLLLVEALSGLKNLRWTLTLFGIQDFDPEYVKQIKEKIFETGLTERIFINKTISGEELTSAYLQSDLFILPSLFENFSMALNEALMHGLPVITTKGGGIPFSVPANMGLFVTPGNANELKQAVFEVLTKPALYKKLYRSSAEYYKSAATWDDSVEMFNKLIIEINN